MERRVDRIFGRCKSDGGLAVESRGSLAYQAKVICQDEGADVRHLRGKAAFGYYWEL